MTRTRREILRAIQANEEERVESDRILIEKGESLLVRTFTHDMYFDTLKRLVEEYARLEEG